MHEDGLLAPGKPLLFPQGSLRLLTTVRPRGTEVYDLDIVCELEAAFASGFTPVQLLDLLEHQLRAHQTYSTMVRRKNPTGGRRFCAWLGTSAATQLNSAVMSRRRPCSEAPTVLAR